LWEVENPLFGIAYDELDCRVRENNATTPDGIKIDGSYDINLSLCEVSSNITITGSFFTQNGSRLGDIQKVTRENESTVKISDVFQVDDNIPKDDIILFVTAEYQARGSVQVVSQAVDIQNDSENYFTHELLHPTRRGVYSSDLPKDRYYGTTDTNMGGGQMDPSDDHITIALFRKPENSEKIDYVCGYEKNGYYPILGLPGKGILRFTKSNVTYKGCFSATCKIERNTGGVALLASKTFQTQEIGGSVINVTKLDDKGIEYEMPSVPDNPKLFWQQDDGSPVIFDYPGIQGDKWQEVEFYYTMTLNLKCIKNGSPITITVNITSKQNQTISANEFPCVSPLKIAWGCLAENTKVLTDTDYRPIQDIKIGDKVLNPRTNKYVRVTNTWIGREQRPMVRLVYDAENEVVMLTQSHPVLTVSGYIQAKDVTTETQCVGRGRKIIRLTDVSIVNFPCNVYNLDTENNEPFLVEFLAVGSNFTQNALC
jgi:hypothetical protein